MRQLSSKSRAAKQSSPAGHSVKMPHQLLPTGPLRLAKLLGLGKGKGMGLSQQQQLGGCGSHKKGGIEGANEGESPAAAGEVSGPPRVTLRVPAACRPPYRSPQPPACPASIGRILTASAPRRASHSPEASCRRPTPHQSHFCSVGETLRGRCCLETKRRSGQI